MGCDDLMLCVSCGCDAAHVLCHQVDATASGVLAQFSAHSLTFPGSQKDLPPWTDCVGGLSAPPISFSRALLLLAVQERWFCVELVARWPLEIAELHHSALQGRVYAVQRAVSDGQSIAPMPLLCRRGEYANSLLGP